jgi:hypothetical protein
MVRNPERGGPKVPNTVVTWRVLDVVMSLLLTIVTGLLTWDLKTTIHHGTSIAKMQAQLFTSDDGLEVWNQIAAIREQLAGIPTEVPPRWFLAEVNELKDRLESIEVRVRNIERRPQ